MVAGGRQGQRKRLAAMLRTISGVPSWWEPSTALPRTLESLVYFSVKRAPGGAVARKYTVLGVPQFGTADALKGTGANGGASVKTLLIGLVITIVFLASCFISAIERIW